MIFLLLFWEFFVIGILGFGGGYAILPLIQHMTVDNYGWLSELEFVDLVTISQITPGPILINAATFVGTKQAGFLGGIAATAGTITPSIIIVLILVILYYKYRSRSSISRMLLLLRPVITGLILVATVGILKNILLQGGEMWIFYTAITVFAYFLLHKTKINPLLLIFAGGTISLFAFYIFGI